MNNFEKHIKSEVDAFEYPYDSNAWKSLENKMSAKKTFFKSNIFKASVITSLLIAISTIIYLNQDDINTSYFIAENTKISEITNTKEPFVESNPIINNETYKEISVAETKIVEQEQPQKEENRKETKIEDNTVTKSNKTKLSSICEEQKRIIKEGNMMVTPCANFNIDSREGCTPFKVNFYPEEQSDSIVYLWEFGDGTMSGDMIAAHIYDIEGVYDVKLTVKYYKTEGVKAEARKDYITVKDKPNADFTISNKGNIYILNALSEDALKYDWIINNEYQSSTSSYEYTFTNSGKQNVILIADNLNGCIDTKTKEVDILIKHNYFVPTAFTPNGDGYNDYFIPVGENLSEYQFEMNIYNKHGQLVFNTKDINRHWDGKIIGTNKLCDAGVYVWVVKTKDKYGNLQKRRGNLMLK